MRKRATIKDVASLAGVSAAAVSAVLSGRGGASIRVSAETREKILKAAAEAEYVPDRRARSLVARRSDIIAVVTYEKVFPVDWRNEFYGFFEGIEEEAARRGCDILILNNRPDQPAGGGRIDRLGMADGAVVIGISRDEEFLSRVVRSGFPLLFVGRREIAGEEPNYATFDYAAPISALAAAAAAAGLAGTEFLPSGSGEPFRDKRRFLAAAFESRGLAFRETGEDLTEDSAARIAREADRANLLLVFASMALADRFRSLAGSAGLQAGTDYQAAVLEDRWKDADGFWTRLDSDRVALGRTAVSCLLDIIDEKIDEPVRRLIPVGLVGGPSAPHLAL